MRSARRSCDANSKRNCSGPPSRLPNRNSPVRRTTRALAAAAAAAVVVALTACVHARVNVGRSERADVSNEQRPALAQVFYWRAKAGMLDAYNRYIAEVAEPIDHDAQAHGAFFSVTTFVSRDTLSTWTHMRVFTLRDSAQLVGLGAALDAAGVRLEPDSVKRRVRGDYAATLRDRVGSAVFEILP